MIVTFSVSPEDAEFAVNGASPASSGGGVYGYDLYKDTTYTYTATKDGYNGITRDCYDTTAAVALVGHGTADSAMYHNLYIVCTVPGVDLTLRDIYIGNDTNAPTLEMNMIDFIGAGNELRFAGTTMLDCDTGAVEKASIHVPNDGALTISGGTDDTLYFYKRSQGAGIGGNSNEFNGAITLAGGNIFIKGVKQGAVVGSGSGAASSADSPGDITINGDTEIYRGGLHKFCFVNEQLQKAHQLPIGNTLQNWAPLSDPNLYLYLTGAPDSGKWLTADSLRAIGATSQNSLTVTKVSDAAYSFIMPDEDVTVTAAFENDTAVALVSPVTVSDGTAATVGGDTVRSGSVTITATTGGGDTDGPGNPFAGTWDGITIDIKWYTDNPNAGGYTLNYPAELVGLAALVNGLYNTNINTVRGGKTMLVVNTSSGGHSDNSDTLSNNKSSETYHWGGTDFAGVTISLGADMDMSDGNYMPIGGQYRMDTRDPETRIDAGFNGYFDGGGHTVTIACDRHVSDGLFGDGSSVGLIGRLGNHDNEGGRASGQGVANVIVEGTVYGNRSVGGIVGKIGKTIGGATIDSCINRADVRATDKKGVGGIVGAAWNGGKISNCYNVGNISGTQTSPVGGIVGSDEVLVENCYSYGRSSGPSGYAMGIGTDNGGGRYSNSFYLTGTAADGGWYAGGRAENGGERTSSYMKSDDFVTDLGSAFKRDSENINSGYPVLQWQRGSAVEFSDVIEPDAKVTNGNAVASVTEKEVTNAIKGAAQNKKDAVTIAPILPANTEITSVSVTLPQVSVKEILDAGLGLNIETQFGDFRFTAAALRAIANGARGSEITITIASVASSALTEAQRERAGERPVVRLTVTSNGYEITDFGGGSVNVSVPYALKKDELPSGVAVYRLGDDAAMTEIASEYNTATRRVEFTLTHFSMYIIGYDKDSEVEWINPFADVSESDWFYEAVKFVSERGLMVGTAADIFSPNVSMTRAMFATVLYRIEGEPSVRDSNQFLDVKSGEWYTDAVIWAAERGIVNGYGDGYFGTNDDVTREQIVAMFYRYASYKHYAATDRRDLEGFSDAGEVSDWAADAMRWAVAAEVIQGRADALLAPLESATRAEVAMFVMRFVLGVAD